MNIKNLKYIDAKINDRFEGRGPVSRVLLLLLMMLFPLIVAAKYQLHTVKKGETLYSLSKRYGVTIEQIKELNQLPDNRLSINQRLKIKLIEEPGSSQPTQVIAPPSVAMPVPPTGNENLASAARPAQTTTPPKDLPESYYYTVQPKDNLYRISVNHGLALKDLLAWNNMDDVTYSIHPGDRLLIKDPGVEEDDVPKPEIAVQPEQSPPARAAAEPDTTIVQKIYVVQRKDTLYKIAKENGMTVDELKKLNNLSSNDISVGQKIWLAGTPPPSEMGGKSPLISEAELQKSGLIRDDLAIPTIGRVTSEFGLRHGRPHKGIDIFAKTGTPIYAVLDGVVVFSGVQGNYGNVIVLEHPDFVMTVYAHNSINLVKVDEKVSKGQLIGYVGSTGNASGPHLHFEYRIKGKAINPRKVLKLN